MHGASSWVFLCSLALVSANVFHPESLSAGFQIQSTPAHLCPSQQITYVRNISLAPFHDTLRSLGVSWSLEAESTSGVPQELLGVMS